MPNKSESPRDISAPATREKTPGGRRGKTRTPSNSPAESRTTNVFSPNDKPRKSVSLMSVAEYHTHLYNLSMAAFEQSRQRRDEAEAVLRAEHEQRILASPKAKTSKKGSASSAAAEFNPFQSVHAPIPIGTQFLTYLGYAILMVTGYFREIFRKLIPNKERGYAPMVRDFDDFFQRRFYRRIRDIFNRPIDSRPGRVIGVIERVSHDYNINYEMTGRIIPAINLSSYNYLGFADDVPYIRDRVLSSVDTFGVGICASSEEGGRSSILHELESTVAAFLAKDDALACGMGFATNFAGIPSLFDKDTLVISDQNNHASIVAGLRVAAARVKVFPHNRFDVLESIIEDAIISGQPRTHVPYKRIVILVEGIYSMEGEIVNLRRVVAIKKKYKCFLYIDEAHSIGALGATGRGVCEHCGVSPHDVDLLMGTFTKSFGSIGGYIAGNKDIIQHIRHSSTISLMAEALSPGCCEQALYALKVMLGEDGTNMGEERVKRLADNSRFFRQGLRDLGLTVLGEENSPVIPMMVYQIGKLASFSRAMLARNIAVVVVGYPATPLLEGRVRFCIAASHTREDLQRALDAVDEVAQAVGLIHHPKNRKKSINSK